MDALTLSAAALARQDLPSAIYERRLELKLLQEGAADMLGVSVRTLSRWETSAESLERIHVGQIAALALFLDTTPTVVVNAITHHTRTDARNAANP